MKKLTKKMHTMAQTIEAYCTCPTCSCTGTCSCTCYYILAAVSTGMNSANVTSYGSNINRNQVIAY